MASWRSLLGAPAAVSALTLACSQRDAASTSGPPGPSAWGVATSTGDATSFDSSTMGATTSPPEMSTGSNDATGMTSAASTTASVGSGGSGFESSSASGSAGANSPGTGMGGVTSAGGATTGVEVGSLQGGAGGSGSAAATCPNSALLCEDFEETTPGDIPSGWTSEGMVSVVSEDAHRGSQSLRVGQAENGPRRIVRSAADLGAEHWGRIFYRVELPVPPAFVHSTLVALAGDSTEYRTVDTVKNEQGQHQFLYNIQPQGNEWGCGSSYDYNFDGEWHCAEWQLSAASQSFRFYYDGAELESIAIDNGVPRASTCGEPPPIPSSFDEIRVGLYNYQQAPPGFVVYLDDLVIATERVLCE